MRPDLQAIRARVAEWLAFDEPEEAVVVIRAALADASEAADPAPGSTKGTP